MRFEGHLLVMATRKRLAFFIDHDDRDAHGLLELVRKIGACIENRLHIRKGIGRKGREDGCADDADA